MREMTTHLQKKILAFVALFLCALFMTTTVFATDYNCIEGVATQNVYGIDIPGSGEPGTFGQTRALADCVYGPHDMLSHGWGSIYNVDTDSYVVSNGACSQCTVCHLVIITQGDPGTGSALGYYTSWQPHEELSSYYTTIRTSSSSIMYTDDSTLPGANFRYS